MWVGGEDLGFKSGECAGEVDRIVGVGWGLLDREGACHCGEIARIV